MMELNGDQVVLYASRKNPGLLVSVLLGGSQCTSAGRAWPLVQPADVVPTMPYNKRKR